MKKNSFTLVEILISISIFSIITLFLYKTLDQTQQTNQFFSNKLQEQEKLNDIKKVLFLDMMEKQDSNITISSNDEYGSIVSFTSTNTLHNPFYTHITYLVSKKYNLIRMESKSKFLLNKTSYEFYDTAYIDVLAKDIEKFNIIKSNGKFVFYIKQKNASPIVLNY